MAPPSNVEATAFILDISPSSEECTESGNKFIYEIINCVTRVIERKIFSRPNDLVSLILLGSEESNNTMFDKGSKAYGHISVATTLSKPTWELMDLLKNKLKISNSDGDWIDGLVIAADHLTTTVEELGIKVSCKKIVLMSDFNTKTTIQLDQLQEIINGFDATGIDLIFIGTSILSDDETILDNLSISEDQQYNLKILSNIVEELDSVKCTFEEANLQLKFHKKKAVNLRPWNVDLSIGKEIKIPISGYGRIRDEPPVKIPWTKVVLEKVIRMGDDNKNVEMNNLIPTETKRIFSKADDNMDMVGKENVIDGYTYGDKTIPFTEIDKSMNYKSGERGLICYGFTKKENINCSHLSDNGITYVIGRKDNDNAGVAVEALATVLKTNGLVLIGRKVYYAGCAPRMVALFPVVKKSHKCLSMVTLAFREDHRHMLLPGLNQRKNQSNDEQLAAMDDLISAMDLSLRGEDGTEIYSIEANINPTLQYMFDSIAYRATHPGKPLIGPRPDVKKLLEVPITVAKLAVEPLKKIQELFPVVAIEKTSGRKELVNKYLSGDKKEDVHADMTFTNRQDCDNSVDAASVLISKTNKIGTINPAEDFLQLSLIDFTSACEELKKVIEDLVKLSLSEDYTKAMTALKEMRLLCREKNPSIYNDWLITFKDILLNYLFKGNFLKQLFENKLGLITSEENESSPITKSFADKFQDFTVNESISKPSEMDEISDLFD